MMRRKLMIVAYAFPPHSVVGAMRPMRFCKYLVQETDWSAVVVSIDKTFPSTDETLLAELPADLRVWRVPVVEPRLAIERWRRSHGHAPAGTSAASHARQAVARHHASARNPLMALLLDALSIPDPQVFWNLHLARHLPRIIRAERPDALLITSPPWSAQIAGRLIARRHRLPWIADLRDPWTDIQRFERPAALDHLDRWLERSCLTHADAVLSTSRTFTSRLAGRYPSRSARFHTLMNGFDEEKFGGPVPPARQELTITHLGTLYPMWQPFAFFCALRSWLDLHPDAARHMRLVLVGEANAEVREVVSANRLEPITEVTGFLDHAQAINRCRQSDALLLAMGTHPELPRGWLPSKLFEYIACERPIIASVAEGDAADLVRRTGSGMVVSNDDHAAFHRIIDDLFERKRSAGEQRISWRNDPAEVEKLTQRSLVRELVGILDHLMATWVQRASP